MAVPTDCGSCEVVARMSVIAVLPYSSASTVAIDMPPDSGAQSLSCAATSIAVGRRNGRLLWAFQQTRPLSSACLATSAGAGCLEIGRAHRHLAAMSPSHGRVAPHPHLVLHAASSG